MANFKNGVYGMVRITYVTFDGLTFDDDEWLLLANTAEQQSFLLKVNDYNCKDTIGMCYFKNNKKHNTEGFAAYYYNIEEFWIDGVRYDSEEDFTKAKIQYFLNSIYE